MNWLRWTALSVASVSLVANVFVLRRVDHNLATVRAIRAARDSEVAREMPVLRIGDPIHIDTLTVIPRRPSWLPAMPFLDTLPPSDILTMVEIRWVDTLRITKMRNPSDSCIGEITTALVEYTACFTKDAK